MPPAADPDVADEGGAPPTLDDASARLESALARLEALVEAGPLQSDLFRAPEDAAPDTDVGRAGTLKAELAAARHRERALEAAAAAASQALGRAMVEVRRALDADGPGEDDRDTGEGGAGEGDGATDDAEGADDALDPEAGTAEEPQP